VERNIIQAMLTSTASAHCRCQNDGFLIHLTANPPNEVPNSVGIIERFLTFSLPTGLYFVRIFHARLLYVFLLIVARTEIKVACSLSCGLCHDKARKIQHSHAESQIRRTQNFQMHFHFSSSVEFVLYGCETWSLTLRVENRLRVFKNRLVRRIFGPKMDEVTVEWRKLHNE
jgi:hypothetical protein